MAEGFRPLKVAVVSRHEMVRAGLRTMLAPYPHRVHLVGSRAVGVARRADDIADADVVLLDPVGPVGTSATGPAAGIDLRVRVVVLSWGPPDLEQALPPGASAHVTASATAAEILAALEHAWAAPPVVLRHCPLRPPSDHPGDEPWLGRAFGLSFREAQMLALIVQGIGNEEIARRTFLSANTVKTYIRMCYRKIGVGTRPTAVVWAMQHGFGADGDAA